MKDKSKLKCGIESAGKEFKNEYLLKLKERKATSNIYREYQLIGLELANILNDQGHKSFYIKLAKTRGSDSLLRIAKDVAGRGNVINKGAYFMRLIHKND